jgi:hypothetical protein
MYNILLSPLDHSQLVNILKASKNRSALPVLGDPIWTELSSNPFNQCWLQPLLDRVKTQANQTLPKLTEALYQDFFKTGTRLPFENIYFERRRQLGQVAIALLLSDASTRDSLIPSFLDKLTDVLDESSWALPAHIWENATGKDPMTIDLFAAETANNFAEMLTALEPVIPTELATRIKDRLQQQFFKNYLEHDPAFGWTQVSNNWNAVCHQGVLGAALTIEQDHELVAQMLFKAAAALPKYLTGFEEDGSTSEGPGYWSYGFGWFSELNAQLEHRSEGQLSLFTDLPKVTRIAHFAPQMTLSAGHFVNFSDSNRKGKLNPALLSYLGQRLHDSSLQAHGLNLYQQQRKDRFNFDELRCDFFKLSRLALRAPQAELIGQKIEQQTRDAYFPDYGTIVTHSTDRQGHLWELAAKAGHNDEHHNHNDCGSWLLNIDKTPYCLEIGSPEYTQSFFSDDRYTHIAARSLGHSVPFVNGVEQAVGRQFAAKVLHVDLTNERAEFHIDLTQCYPTEANCKKLHRHWLLDKNMGKLTITDQYELTQTGSFESMVIAGKDTCKDGQDAIIPIHSARIRIQPGPGTQIQSIESCDYRGHHGSDETVQQIRFAPNKQSASGSLTYTVLID